MSTTAEQQKQYDTDKDDPRFALRMLGLMLVHCLGSRKYMPDERLQKARHLLKTLGMAAGIDGGEIDRAWPEASGPEDEEP